jgi:hypothetical protein
VTDIPLYFEYSHMGGRDPQRIAIAGSGTKKPDPKWLVYREEKKEGKLAILKGGPGGILLR